MALCCEKICKRVIWEIRVSLKPVIRSMTVVEFSIGLVKARRAGRLPIVAASQNL
jgi:hypothetical protein